MKLDTIVFDIETKNFFTDPEVGWNNFGALEISMIGVYSYAQDKYFSFEETEMVKAGELFREASRLVGFSSNRYDIPVLNLHFKALKETSDIDLWQKERVDILEELEMAMGKRVSLSKLAEANLGVAKDHSGAEAIEFYKHGRIEELRNYCLEDVRLTKELYDLYRNRGYFLVADKVSGELQKVQVKPPETQAMLF